MTLTNKLIIFTLIGFLSSCLKQEPTPVDENGYRESIKSSRLSACTEMNLFTNTFEKNNVVAIFDCTQWDEKFPVLRDEINNFNRDNWNKLLLPLSTYAFNDREVLRKSISVTQLLDEQNGLEDLGQVITALNDTNFYDGMNALFECASGSKSCNRKNDVEKSDVLNLFGATSVLKNNIDNLHSVMASAVNSLNVLSDDFSELVTGVLSSQEFISKRVEMLDLGIKFLTMPRSDLERNFLPSIFAQTPSVDGLSLFSWVNSNEFNSDLFRKIVSFVNQNPLAIKDLRSLAQIRDRGLKCSHSESNNILIDLDTQIYILLGKIRDLDMTSLEGYLADDLAMHQVAMQACSNLQKIEVELDGERHVLDVVRMKKSMIDFISIPGVVSLMKTISRDLLLATKGDVKQLGNFMSQQMDDNYIGVVAEWLEIIQKRSPDLFDEYVRYIKSIPQDTYLHIQSLVTYLVSPEQDKIWNSARKVWFFFEEKEKNFLFNYLDRHFSPKTNYKALFAYYLDIFTVLKTALPKIADVWLDKKNEKVLFDGLAEVAMRFHGSGALNEFKSFFSRSHILKVIELFINGEKLSTWANQIRQAIPQTQVNSARFTFSNQLSGNGLECLNQIAMSDLDVLIKNFPSSCNPLVGQPLLERLSVIAQLASDYVATGNSTPFAHDGLFSPKIIQSLIVASKKSLMSVLEQGGDSEQYIKWMSSIILDDRLRTLLQDFDQLIETFDTNSVERLKEKSQKIISEALVDEKLLLALKLELNEYSIWRKKGLWVDIANRQYPEKDEARSCKKTNNPNIGGSVCPSKEEFVKFVENLVGLMVRRNDESPLAIRQFLNALDPQVGLQIPLRGVKTETKNLTIRESMQMFWDLTDKSNPLNTQKMPYETSDGKTDQEVTTMERIEVVIRDVNFDANYLGAHYKNSVAKSYDYLKVVGSKYSMFKLCVGARFCGKFMNRSEKRMARNAVAAFPALMDVEMHGLNYGDYMKALIGAVVSSSSKASQISNIIKFKRSSDGFNIPWIQTKKQLRKHNGVILSELAGIAAFSNMARWSKDRFGRTESDYEQFLQSPELKIISEKLFSGVAFNVDDKVISDFLIALSSSEIVPDIWDWVDSLEYKELRRVEDFIGDILVIAATGMENQEKNYWNEMMVLGTRLIASYPKIKKQWGEQKIVDMIKNAQPFLEFFSERIARDEANAKSLLKMAVNYVNDLLLNEDEYPSLLTLIPDELSTDQSSKVVGITQNLNQLIAQEWTRDNLESGIGIKAFADSIETNGKTFEGLSEYFAQTSSRRSCRADGELVVCQQNKHYLEPWKLASFVVSSSESWARYVAPMFNNPTQLSKWMTDSLSLIKLEN